MTLPTQSNQVLQSKCKNYFSVIEIRLQPKSCILGIMSVVELGSPQLPCLCLSSCLLPSLSCSKLIIHSYIHSILAVVDISFKAKANLLEPFDLA